MVLLQLRQLLFPPRQLCLGCGRVLFSGHMIEHNDVPLLQVKAVQMVQCILSLPETRYRSNLKGTRSTHIHHVIEYNVCSPLCFLLITDPNLANTPVPSEQVIQVFACDLVVQVLDEQNPICAWRQLRLIHMSEILETDCKRRRTVDLCIAIVVVKEWSLRHVWWLSAEALYERLLSSKKQVFKKPLRHSWTGGT